MKKTKKLITILILSSLIILGCGRKNKEAAERLEHLDEKVATLYNEEKNDLHTDISEEKMAAIEKELEAEKEEKLNEANEKKRQEIEDSFKQAKKMYEVDQEIQDLFEEDDILKEHVALEQIEEAEQTLADFNVARVQQFVDRQEKRFLRARKQLKIRSQAERLITRLFENEETVRENVTRAKEKEAHEAVEKIDHPDLREHYKERLLKVNEALTKAEEEEARRKAARSIGDFAGMYLSEDNFIYYLDEKVYLIAKNTESDNLVIYQIQEIRNNTGQEVTMKLFEKASEMHNTEDTVHEEILKLSEDKQTLTDVQGNTATRLSKSEQEEVFSRLNALEDLIEEYSQ